MEFTDLSVPLNEKTPVFPGDPKLRIEPAGVLEKHGYEDHQLHIGNHIGTHIDAPRHMIRNGKNLDDFSIEKFIGNGVLVNAKLGYSLEKLRKSNIKKDDVVIFQTSKIQDYFSAKYFTDYPDLPEEVAKFLIGKKVKIVGMDACSPDHEPFPIHKLLLSAGILLVENLTNLEKLEGKEFTIYALPIKLQVDGAPARVIAQLQ